MTRRKDNIEIIQQPPAPPETPTFTLDRIFELEKHARECLNTVISAKQELKEAKEVYDNAVDTLMNTIRKAHEPEFNFSVSISGKNVTEED